jgi:hypothetical protein
MHHNMRAAVIPQIRTKWEIRDIPVPGIEYLYEALDLVAKGR